MKTMNGARSVLGMIAALALAGCASTAPSWPHGELASPGNASSEYGVVQSIERVQQGNSGSRVGLGTVAGAVVGGIVGNQVGSGRGNTAATVLGAAGGAYVGHELENRNQQQTEAYRITVRMEDGSSQTLTQSTTGGLREGDQVRAGNGVVQRY